LRHGAGFADYGYGSLGKIVQASIAWGHCAVAVGYTDYGLVEVIVAEADGAEHGAIGRALDALCDELAAFIGAHFFAFCERLSLLAASSHDASDVFVRALENVGGISMHEDETRKNKTSATKAIFCFATISARLPFGFAQGKKSCPDKTFHSATGLSQ
jgi:hypothetical protein